MGERYINNLTYFLSSAKEVCIFNLKELYYPYRSNLTLPFVRGLLYFFSCIADTLQLQGVGEEELEAKELAPHIPLNSVGSLCWTFLLNNNVINTASIHEPCHSPQMFYKPAK